MSRFLIVDDDEMSSMMLANFLQKYAPCDVCGNGLEGLERFDISLRNGVPYDLVCIDLAMPIMNGHVLLRKIRELEAERARTAGGRVKIFIVSASNSPWDMADTVLDNIADDYIVKPFTGRNLVTLLDKHNLE